MCAQRKAKTTTKGSINNCKMHENNTFNLSNRKLTLIICNDDDLLGERFAKKMTVVLF